MVVIVYADGTEEIVKSSMAVEDGVIVSLEEDATVKVIDNSKDFVDVPEDSTFAEAIDYMTSHELMNGVADYAKMALAWVVENNIMQGNNGNLNPAGNATRNHVAAMYMRYMQTFAEV